MKKKSLIAVTFILASTLSIRAMEGDEKNEKIHSKNSTEKILDLKAAQNMEKNLEYDKIFDGLVEGEDPFYDKLDDFKKEPSFSEHKN